MSASRSRYIATMDSDKEDSFELINTAVSESGSIESLTGSVSNLILEASKTPKTSTESSGGSVKIGSGDDQSKGAIVCII